MTTPPPAPPPSRFKRSLKPLGLIGQFLLLWLVTATALHLVARAVLGPGAVASIGVLSQWISLASVLIPTYVMLRLVEKLPWATVGLGRSAAAPAVLLTGTLWGALSIGLASVLLIALGQLRIVPTPDGSWWAVAAGTAAALLPAAFSEELLMRGYLFSVLGRLGGWRLALIVTSVVFGLMHAWNPGADPRSITSVIVAGFLLGAVLLATGSLYAAGAAHFAWNWTMAALLHAPISGLPAPTPDYRTVDAGPDWLTGGSWGPEAGLAALAVELVLLFILYGRVLRRMESHA